MIEIPEADHLSKQLETTFEKRITHVEAGHSPNRFAWYTDDPADYPSKLNGKIISQATAVGGMIELTVDNLRIVFSDGITLQYVESPKRIPKKHQLLLSFEDSTSLCASLKMYGGLLCETVDKLDNKYYRIAKEKPSPLSTTFNAVYFQKLIDAENVQKLSLKALLATEQRIPGLGNGVLQDILYTAKLHPKRKVNTLSDTEKSDLFSSTKETLKEMTVNGGRDTEKDLFGNNGGYRTKASKNSVGTPCSRCGSSIEKSNYMGGSIYFCPNCQTH